MKKIYSLASALLLTGFAVAQNSESQSATKTIATNTVSHASQSQDRAPGDIIGSVMTFTTPADWVINNGGVTGGGWVIGTLAPDGPFSGGMGTISSTSGGNFALFDADGATGEGFITMANSVNLTAYSNVAFEFESYYRNFQGDAYFEISTNGTTWTTFQVHSLLPLNESTSNPEVISVNITTVAAGQATVWARFRYVSADDYAWMVDDVAFVEGFTDNLIMEGAYLSMGIEFLDYYIIPTSQIQPYTFGSWVANNGTNNQTSTILNVVVNDGSTDIYDQSSTSVTVPAFSSDSLELTTPAWTAPGAGVYEVTYTTSSSSVDQTIADNSIVLEDITVGGIVYARDNGIETGSVGYLGSTPVPTSMGNYFEFFNNYNLGKIQIGISSSSTAGDLVYGEVRVWDGTDFVFVDQTDDYTLTAGDLGTIITLTLDNPILCADGEVYYVGGAHYGSDVRVMTAQIAEGAVIYNDGAASQQNSVFIVRLEEVFVGVDEITTVTNFSVYPNPANEIVNVSYELASAGNVSLTVTDISGKVIMSNDLGVQTAGSYKSNLNTASLANGVYFYTLTVDGISTTTKMTIAKN